MVHGYNPGAKVFTLHKTHLYADGPTRKFTSLQTSLFKYISESVRKATFRICY